MPYLLAWRARLGLSTIRRPSSIGSLRCCATPLIGNGKRPVFDPPRRARLDACRAAAHIPRVMGTTPPAGIRRISQPSPLRARALLIRPAFAEDLFDVVPALRYRPRR